MARLLNRKRDIIPPDAISIMRPGPWGNPFVSSRMRTRAEAIALFEKHVLPTLDVEPLRGKDIFCCCVPSACHGHSIMRKLYGENWNADSN